MRFFLAHDNTYPQNLSSSKVTKKPMASAVPLHFGCVHSYSHCTHTRHFYPPPSFLFLWGISSLACKMLKATVWKPLFLCFSVLTNDLFWNLTLQSHLQEIHQNGGYTISLFVSKTVMFPFIVAALLFFVRRIKREQREWLLLEKYDDFCVKSPKLLHFSIFRTIYFLHHLFLQGFFFLKFLFCNH